MNSANMKHHAQKGKKKFIALLGSKFDLPQGSVH